MVGEPDSGKRRAQRGDLPGHHRDELVRVAELDHHEPADLEQLVARSDSEYLNRSSFVVPVVDGELEAGHLVEIEHDVDLEHVVLAPDVQSLALDLDGELGRVALGPAATATTCEDWMVIGSASAR